ncbi:MAG: TolC family protein [Marinilabiliaceae bacterium]
MKCLSPLFSLLLLPLFAQAQTVSLEQCQRLAQENYPLIKQYDLISQTTGFTVSNISKGWLPQVSVIGQLSVQNDVMTLPAPLEAMLSQQGYDVKGLNKTQYRVGVDVNQNLYDGGAIKRGKEVARREGEVRTAQVTTDLYAVRQRINDIYFGILLTDEKIKLNQNLQALLQSNIDKLNSMLSNGVAMPSDVNSIKAELLNAKQQAAELDASRSSLARILSLFIGTSFTDLDMPNDTDVTSGSNNRPELSLFDAQLSLFDARESILSANRRPKLCLFAQGYFGYPGYDMFDAMFDHGIKLSGIVGLRLSWNVGAFYTKGNDRERFASQRALVESSRQTFLFNNHLVEVQQADGVAKYRQLVQDDKEIVLLRGDVRQAAEAKLDHGVIDTNNLLQEITRENQSRIDLSTHTILMLKEIYDLKFTTNN